MDIVFQPEHFTPALALKVVQYATSQKHVDPIDVVRRLEGLLTPKDLGTPLRHCLRYRHHESALVLVRQGVNINKQGIRYYTPFVVDGMHISYTDALAVEMVCKHKMPLCAFKEYKQERWFISPDAINRILFRYLAHEPSQRRIRVHPQEPRLLEYKKDISKRCTMVLMGRYPAPMTPQNINQLPLEIIDYIMSFTPYGNDKDYNRAMAPKSKE